MWVFRTELESSGSVANVFLIMKPSVHPHSSFNDWFVCFFMFTFSSYLYSLDMNSLSDVQLERAF